MSLVFSRNSFNNSVDGCIGSRLYQSFLSFIIGMPLEFSNLPQYFAIICLVSGLLNYDSH